MHWLYTTFKDYCQKKGIHLLRGDLKYIEKELVKIPKELQRSVMSDYTRKWVETMDKENNSLLKQNLARRKANLWLLTRQEKNKNDN